MIDRMIVEAVATSLVDWNRVLVAVSGGVDSTVLLHAVTALSKQRSLVVEVAHVDHGLRENSFADMQFVEELALDNSLILHTKTLQSPGSGVNIEEWGRCERYRFFREVMEKRSLEVVITAHHANDVVETLWMRLLSNKEPYGIMSFDPQRSCVRPLLKIERRVIEEYATKNNLKFMVDDSNQDTARLRNRIRQRLMPVLEQEFGREVIAILAHRASCLQDDLLAMNVIADAGLKEIASLGEGSKLWVRAFNKQLSFYPAMFKWRFCERWLLPHLNFNIGRLHGDRVVEFFLRNRQGVQLPSGWQIVRKTGGVQIVRANV